MTTLTREAAGNLTQLHHWFRYWMPYTFWPSQHKHTYLPLNRNYKPLGFLGTGHVRYEEHEDRFVSFFRDPHTFADVWHNVNGLYLYDDSIDSRKDYFDRLARLLSKSMTLKVAKNFPGSSVGRASPC